MSAFLNLVEEDRRLVVLRFLAEDSGYTLNTSVLQDALCRVGHCVSRDQVSTLAAWLSEQGLVETETVGPVTVVRLTARGADVAAGRSKAPGVKRPLPR